ncbi:PucR family transcriptional regulator [Nocardioides astragali]|uniref:PucR family transcriptional regulator n=1 Tax=Nocardioides astragali TaxID=1776736 RepID=A0ABW2N340_9ACTN|nr:helix-turn-helix domain-containing protein [Nocardioides astragali]
MTAEVPGTTVGMLVAELGPTTRLLTAGQDLDRLVSGASILSWGEPSPVPEVVLISVQEADRQELKATIERLGSDVSRVLVLTHPASMSPAALREIAGSHVIIEAAEVDPAEIVLLFAGARTLGNDTATRRLTALQRSLTQVLGEEDPLVALLHRLKSTCNATAALVDKHGRTVHATGPLPLSSLFQAISHTAAETQLIDVDGWTGVADRIHDAGHQGGYFGWLVVTARRDGFPNAYDSSAVHVAASLVEASQRMSAVTRQQERAVRAAVLEEALALVPMPAAPELSGRVASLGLSWTEEMRAVVVRVVRQGAAGRAKPALKEATDLMTSSLEDAAVPHLVSKRKRFTVLLVQASPAALRRAIVSTSNTMPSVLVGVGRQVASIEDVATSFHDAQLAVQTLRRAGRRTGLMSYEDFDFATRLFSDVGSARMTRWAREFLGPLENREPLLEGLRQFFQHGQNMNAAADALNIHHNSLRYRLAKVEELLEVNLRDPAAVASVFLAMAALELEQVSAPDLPTKRGPGDQPADIAAPRSVRDAAPPTLDSLGVVFGPDRG